MGQRKGSGWEFRARGALKGLGKQEQVDEAGVWGLTGMRVLLMLKPLFRADPALKKMMHSHVVSFSCPLPFLMLIAWLLFSRS